jgi:nucleoside 2-deoxyribosyltransferase
VNKDKVYLGGRMDGVSIEEGNTWRKKSTAPLVEAGFSVYNPYDGKSDDKEDHLLHTPNEIHHRDVYFLNRSSILLVNLDMPEVIKAKDAPFFTIGEMYLAFERNMPIISYANPFVGRHGYEAIVTKTLGNLDEAVEYIIANY